MRLCLNKSRVWIISSEKKQPSASETRVRIDGEAVISPGSDDFFSAVKLRMISPFIFELRLQLLNWSAFNVKKFIQKIWPCEVNIRVRRKYNPLESRSSDGNFMREFYHR